MLREADAVKSKVEEFFRLKRRKDAQVRINFFGDILSIDVDVICGGKIGMLRIRNDFFTKTGGWEELTDKLEGYWTAHFPNEVRLEIVPWNHG